MDDDDEDTGPHGKAINTVLWTIQTCCIVCCALAILASVFAMKFVLVPLIMAYFVTFLMAPITDAMENRPYQ